MKDALRTNFKSLEDEVENLRRKITRDVSDVGGLILNRDNMSKHCIYTMDEISRLYYWNFL